MAGRRPGARRPEGAGPDPPPAGPGPPSRAPHRPKREVEVRLAVTGPDLETAFEVREQVFVEEQGYTEAQEFDELDRRARHFVATVGGGHGAPVVGTARLLLDDRYPTLAVIGRVAVLGPHRLEGVGTALVRRVVEEAASLGVGTLRAGVQVQALGFWRKLGFVPTGEPYMDCHVPHEWAVLRLRTE
jgi:predicted GNAT family N-acyltransferase